MVPFILSNWEYFLVGFMALEKIVKLTPATLVIWGIPIGKYDDIILDIFWSSLRQLVGKGGTKQPPAA